DLAEVVLTLKAAGIDDIHGFPWLEKPDPKSLERAETLLEDLGAIGGGPPPSRERGEGTSPPVRMITDLGRRMLRFPMHPRYARMFLAAQDYGCVRPVALMSALTQGRNFLLRNVDKRTAEAREELFGDEHESDFFLLMRAWRYADKAGYNQEACRRLGIHVQAVRQVGPLFEQFLEIAAGEGLEVAEKRIDGVAVRKCVLLGFSDHVARRLDKGTLRCELVHKRKGLLARESCIDEAPLFVAADITEIESRGEVNTLLNLCTAIDEAWLKELFPEDFADAGGVVYDPTIRRVLARKERRFRDLVLESKQTAGEPPDGEAAALLAREVLAGNIVLTEWNEAVEQWIVRVNCLAKWWPELEVNPITEADRATLIEQICYGSHGARELKDKPVMPVLRDWLLPEQLAVLDEYLPERLVMANGRKARLTYVKDGPPVLSARIQELYGVASKFTLGRGRVPVKIEVLAPNQRPIQVTDDLANFWREQYPKIKPELSRRYPRHEWR
ncbi:MAG TPA: ATP-dependent helicase C-terminal domain-containing protein, partial [Lacunisphaera sp.]|nr:ATP-dependent helicase C-terminal domain-containing protein [Lacunisphaera sp.]